MARPSADFLLMQFPTLVGMTARAGAAHAAASELTVDTFVGQVHPFESDDPLLRGFGLGATVGAGEVGHADAPAPVPGRGSCPDAEIAYGIARVTDVTAPE